MGAFDQFVSQFVKYSNKNKKKFFFISAEPNKNKIQIKMLINFIFLGEKIFYLIKLFSVYYLFLSKGCWDIFFFGYGLFFPQF